MTDDVFGIVGTIQAGAFRVDAVVAEGGFAVVYRAHHGGFRSDVALKCLKVPEGLTGAAQQEFLGKFREEAELLFRLSALSTHIVRPLHVGTLTDVGGKFVPFIAIEWLEGETLDRAIEGRRERGEPPMPLSRLLELLGPIAGALDRAHKFPAKTGQVSIVHRDLKPENIFVADVHGQEVPKILDFGIAKVKSVATQIVGRQSARQDAISAFTPAYGAPEQWLPKRFGQTGSWTDVWGLAITAVECLCGYTPMEGDAAAMMGSAIDPVRRPTPRAEGVGVSDAVEAVFQRALAVDPKDRYHDVALFWSDLQAAARGERSVVAAPVSRGSLPPDPRSRTVPVAAAAVPDLVAPSPARAQAPTRVAPATQAVAASTLERRPVSPPKSASSVIGGGAFEDAGGIGVPIGLQSVGRSRPRPGPVYGVVATRPRLDLGRPITLLGVAVALMAADWAYATTMAESFQVGPVRTIWVAGPLALLGAVSLVLRLIEHGD